MTPAPHLLCLGLGYTAGRLARAAMARGWRVTGTSRTARDAATLETDGIRGLVFDREHPLPGEALEDVTHVLVSVPPDDQGDPVLEMFGEALAAAPGLRWVGYLSTTGVYGDAGGAWVDETSPTRPTQARSRRRAEAEAGWLALHRDHGVPVEIFRLAGIYGPGRSAIDSVRAGTAHRVVKPGHVTCRIHVDDIARALAAAMEAPAPGTVFNLADDEPAPPQDVVAEACALLGVAPPPEVPLEAADISPMARSFYADTRRVSAARIKARLGLRWRHPTYREGLRAILAEEGDAPRATGA
ncbi:SDR family oxidoreductase [uncultured Rhodospira sp.]|uniref:SDR family oxidoreductase n=1 Tax=uncultured Rhodospira sp. TaxID=1936189 RepID=UPI00262D9D6D|nr:SDR family oxidoreductase [uncultured Rhodospira sp.]